MSAIASGRPSDEGAPLADIQVFAAQRGRPAVFLFLQDSLDRHHLHELQSVLGDRQFEEIDLIIHSGGGDINVAYQMVELTRLHTEHLFACVPLYAKSAATLLCLGADEIFVDKLAQLGPLDAQVYEEKKGGFGEFTSALNPFKALERLQAFSLEALDKSVMMLVNRSRLNVDECIQHAISFVVGTTRPLFSQLNPEKLGEYSRALAVGSEYGNRLLRRFSSWDDAERFRVVDQLVHGYPSHDYIIDYHELEELGFKVQLFEGTERDAIQNALLKAAQAVGRIEGSNSLICLVEPDKSAKKTRPKEPKEAVS